MKSLPTRRPGISAPDPTGHFLITVGYDPTTKRPCEVFINNIGRCDLELEDILINIGMTASKIMQGQTPTPTSREGAE